MGLVDMTNVRRLARLPENPERAPVLLTEQQLARIASALDITAAVARGLNHGESEATDLDLRTYIVGQLKAHFDVDGTAA